jgi:phage-related protein
MANAFHAISDFFKSIFELIFSFFQTAFDLVSTIIRSIFSFVGSILNVFVEFAKGIVDVVGGLGKFVLGKFFVSWHQNELKTNTSVANAAVIMLVAAGAYGYLYYQRRQGNTVQVQGKKLN